MDEEQKMVRDIKGLDSDMQTLVYENYNKFISATDTIRKVNNCLFKYIGHLFPFYYIYAIVQYVSQHIFLFLTGRLEKYQLN